MPVQQIVPLRYNDMKALEADLNRLFPGQEWSVEVRCRLLFCPLSELYFQCKGTD